MVTLNYGQSFVTCNLKVPVRHVSWKPCVYVPCGTSVCAETTFGWGLVEEPWVGPRFCGLHKPWGQQRDRAGVRVCEGEGVCVCV